MSDARFRRTLGVGSVLLLVMVLIADWSRTPESSSRLDEKLRQEREPESQMRTDFRGQSAPDPARQAMRSGYRVREMSGIVGRIGFYDGYLYVENHNRFDWQQVEITLDSSDVRALRRVPASSARRVQVDRAPRTIAVSATGPNEHTGVLKVVAASDTH